MTVTSANKLGVEIEFGMSNLSGAMKRLVEDGGDFFDTVKIAWRKDGPVAGHHTCAHVRAPFQAIANVR
jgi:hypothetical protein